MNNLFKYINRKIPLAAEDEMLLAQYFTHEKIAPKTFLLSEGKVENAIYFIEQGVVKAYRNLDGKHVVEHLTGNGSFFTSIESFTKSKPSVEYVESITNCEIYKLTKQNFESLSESSGKWKAFFEQLLNESLICKMDRVKDFQTLTAKQRYEKFILQNAHIALQVPVEALASFLGIEPQSLSRIRRQVIM